MFNSCKINLLLLTFPMVWTILQGNFTSRCKVWTTNHPDGNGAAKITLEHFSMWPVQDMNMTELAIWLRDTAGQG